MDILDRYQEAARTHQSMAFKTQRPGATPNRARLSQRWMRLPSAADGSRTAQLGPHICHSLTFFPLHFIYYVTLHLPADAHFE